MEVKWLFYVGLLLEPEWGNIDHGKKDVKARGDGIRCALTPEGERVQLLSHAEAPEGAVFLGDVHTEILLHIDYVKNDLSNQTARLGGNLLVLDDIQQDIRDGQTWGYIGIGRAYKNREKSN